MIRKLGYVIPLSLAGLLLLVVAVAAQSPAVEQVARPAVDREGGQVSYTYNRVITVTSGTDPDTSQSSTCYTGQVAPDGKCTLRRAIVESRNVPAGDRPVLIRFDIPADPAEGYVASLGIWKINPLATGDASVFRRLKGKLIIDGNTQPGGRQQVGPKIFIVGPGTGQKDGFIVGDLQTDNEIEIYGLALQNFTTHMYVNSSDNVLEGNWFGLNDTGTAPHIRNNDPEDGSGNAGISLQPSANRNAIRNNVFLGLDGVAAAIRGDDNVFENNLVGTRADGSLDKQSDPQLVCKSVDWLGGGGVSVADDGNTIQNNTFAGLRQEVFAITTQPDAIRAEGDHHVIQNNKIGVDGTAAEVGVCGRGIFMAGANTPEYAQIVGNTIVNPGMSAISINGLLVDANTMRSNVIKQVNAWPQIEGNAAPEDAIQFGTTVPLALRSFKPAQVTSVNGTAVSGTSGAGSPCPNCTVEVFLDDTDSITEALQSLAVVVADAGGNWATSLPFELPAGHGLRTTSTTAAYNTISGMDAGTTTKLSSLQAAVLNRVFLPIVVRNQ